MKGVLVRSSLALLFVAGLASAAPEPQATPTRSARADKASACGNLLDQARSKSASQLPGARRVSVGYEAIHGASDCASRDASVADRRGVLPAATTGAKVPVEARVRGMSSP